MFGEQCVNCRQDLNLLLRITGEDAIDTKDGGKLCPSCYVNLSPESHEKMFQ